MPLLIIIIYVWMRHTLESFYNRQVVEDSLASKKSEGQEIGTLAVTAQRRLIIANLKPGNFCSEPPPEVADSITTAIATALKANITQDKNMSAELASNFARHVNQLYKRTHTVQLFRDLSFHLCFNAVNTANNTHTGYDSYKENLTKMVELFLPSLDKEVALYYATETVRANNPPKVMQEMIICDSFATVTKKKKSRDRELTTNINCKPLTALKDNKMEVVFPDLNEANGSTSTQQVKPIKKLNSEQRRTQISNGHRLISLTSRKRHSLYEQDTFFLRLSISPQTIGLILLYLFLKI